MKKIHYSRTGYNGDFTYTSVCGKKVKTHQDNEESTIHPEEANCKKCIKTVQYKTDLNDCVGKGDTTIKRRIFIESDILQADELRSAQGDVADFIEKEGLKYVDRVFSKVLDAAWHDLEKTWEAVKKADEIYATSSLMPLSGGSYMGAPVIFNGMMERAIKNIYWDMIDMKLMKQAFKNNELYMYDDKYNLVKIDVSKIKKN